MRLISCIFYRADDSNSAGRGGVLAELPVRLVKQLSAAEGG